MYYTNSMNLTMKNAEAASAALEILKTRLAAGFECDASYKRCPSQLMSDALVVVKNKIRLPEDFGCCTPVDAQDVFLDLSKALIENLPSESFTCETYSESDYDTCTVEAQFDCSTLTVKSAYYPNGICATLCCEECGENIVYLNEYEEGKTYICPECGEEIDLSDAYEECKPVVEETIINIK